MSKQDLKKFWAEAISTAVYLKNRSPTKALKTTPYEAWHGTMPKVDHLRVLGSDVMLISQRMNNRNSTQNQESVSWSATEQ